ncbi:hypothetical protein [Ferviditalea candida]|uniref:Uncharacterized protein n=1 Tax=Ferviditalea candida TaxID=3108399 RepID=A0ABU5ZKQ3_9BACL|nr:hypothetical protein [Paenibacillaceae bacterium T2]
MNEEEARKKALEARDLYNLGRINFKQAEEMMAEYREIFNARAVEIAKKYGQKPQKFSVKMYIKYGK